MIYTEFGQIPRQSYGCMMIDPPWQFLARTDDGYEKSPQAHYDCMSIDELAALDVAGVGQRSCVVWLWAIWPMVDQACDLLRAWGFRVASGGAWGKRSSTGRAWSFGPGYFFRGASEPFLLGVRGAPAIRVNDQRNIIVDSDYLDVEQCADLAGLFLVEPRREHSRKPETGYAVCERLFYGPHIEMFSRTGRPGWSVFGDEVGKFDGGRR